MNLLLKNLHEIDTSEDMPRNVYDLRQAEHQAMLAADFNVAVCPITPPRTRDGHLMVQSERLELIYHDLLDVCEQLVNATPHRGWTQWHYTATFTKNGVESDIFGNHVFISEMWTARWWKEEQLKIGERARLLVPIISADETPITMTGRNVFPVYATVGNVHKWFKQKRSGWALVGFIPTVRPIKAYKNTEAVRQYRREIKRWCMTQLTETVLQNKDGYIMNLRNVCGMESVVVYPRIPFFVGDEPEVKHAVVGCYGGTNCNMPCTTCVCVPTEHGIRTICQGRDENVVRHMFNPITQTSNMTKEFSKHNSLHPEFNSMFFRPGLNPFKNPSCRFHQFEHGNWEYMKDECMRYISDHGPSGSIGQFDVRWAELGEFPGCKVFKGGISALAWVTAHEQRVMAMGFPFVVRGMRWNMTESNLLPNVLEDISITYLCMRWLVSHDGYTIQKLDALSAIITRFQDLLDQLHIFLHGEPVYGKIKFHKLGHWREYIELYGMTGGYDMGVFDSAHKFTCKSWKGNLSFKRQGSAEKKLLTQYSINEYHTDSHPEVIGASTTRVMPDDVAIQSPNVKWKRTGCGGFRGKRDFGVTDIVKQVLEEYESSRMFHTDSLDKVTATYQDVLPIPLGSEIATLLFVLHKSHVFMNIIVIPDSKLVDTPLPPNQHGQMTIFSSGSYNQIQLWNSSWHHHSNAYMRANNHISYVLHNSRCGFVNNSQIGRLRWMVSVREHQFLIIQKLRLVPSRYGPRKNESAEARILRLKSELCWQVPDPIAAHCWSYKLLPIDDPNNYVVIECGEAGNGSIESIVHMQPDFDSSKGGDANTVDSFFLLEYII